MFKKMNISDLIEIQEFREFYTPQSIEDLVMSYNVNGQKWPIAITESNEIINGYRMVDAIKKAGGTEVNVIVMEGPTSLKDRILLNKTRTKTTQDEISEMKQAFINYPKKQGVKFEGEFDRNYLISSELNEKWKGETSINKLEKLINDDFGCSVLLPGIIERNWKLNSCFDYLNEYKGIDESNKYDYSQRIIKGEITPAEAIKFIQDKVMFDTEYECTFKIPEKANSYVMDCVEMGNLAEYYKTVATIFTSVPYFNLRSYDNGDIVQLGHEKTKEEYCYNVAQIFKKLTPVMKDSGNIFINIGETIDDGLALGIPMLLMATIIKETSLIYKGLLIWQKKNPRPEPENISRPTSHVEYILWFVVDPKVSKYKLLTFPVKGKISKPANGCKDVTSKGVVSKKSKRQSKPYGRISTLLKEQEVEGIILTAAGKNHEVYKISQEGHPAIMSPLLPVVPILMSTDVGDIVYDPFSGTNVVGKISLLLGMVALSTEITKSYYNIGCKMLEAGVAEFDRDELDAVHELVYRDHKVGNENLETAA